MRAGFPPGFWPLTGFLPAGFVSKAFPTPGVAGGDFFHLFPDQAVDFRGSTEHGDILPVDVQIHTDLVPVFRGNPIDAVDQVL